MNLVRVGNLALEVLEKIMQDTEARAEDRIAAASVILKLCVQQHTSEAS